MNRSLYAVVVAALSFAAGCSSTGTTATTGSAAQDLTASDAPTSAVDVLRRGGTFMFSLDESDPAAHFRAQCAKENGDKASADACYARIAAIGDQEGLRFETDQAGETTWTSFGHGGDEVYLQVKLALSADGNSTVVGTPVGPVTGLQHHPETLSPLRFEVVDATTLVTHDEKGKLVFHRKDG